MKKIKRSEQKASDTWNLGLIFKDDEEVRKKIKSIPKLIEKVLSFKGKLNSGKDSFLNVLKAMDEVSIELETIGEYVFLRTQEDGSDNNALSLMGEYSSLATEFEAKTSFYESELSSIPEGTIREYIEDKDFVDYWVMLKEHLKDRKHILSEKEEKLMAYFSGIGKQFSKCFDSLTDVDFNFGEVDGKPLTHSTFSVFLNSKDSKIRKEAYCAYYKKYDESKYLISNLYEGCVNKHVYEAKARGFSSVLDMALFNDRLPLDVYSTLVKAVNNNLPILHKYYDFRRKMLHQKVLNHWDVYVPLCDVPKSDISYDEAVNYIIEALMPLGKEYTDKIKAGFTTERWVDKYENIGKASGAFSAGGYKTLPYILLSYKNDSMRDIFTLAHEGGHSMHSYYSKKNNPYSCYNYTIFEAEIASTFNEEMLFNYLFERMSGDKKLYLITKRMDDIVATYFRQTMFAEFEKKVFEDTEKSQAITFSYLYETYENLLKKYFGKNVVFEKVSPLECLRIPHFYRPFYVFKYATGIASALHLAKNVREGGEKEREKYIGFLKSGGSKEAYDNLKSAGVDILDETSISAPAVELDRLLKLATTLL